MSTRTIRAGVGSTRRNWGPETVAHEDGDRAGHLHASRAGADQDKCQQVGVGAGVLLRLGLLESLKDPCYCVIAPNRRTCALIVGLRRIRLLYRHLMTRHGRTTDGPATKFGTRRRRFGFHRRRS